MNSLPKAIVKELTHQACDYVHQLARLPKEKIKKVIPKASPLEVVVNVAKRVNLKRFVPDPTKPSYEFEAEVELPPSWLGDRYHLEVGGKAKFVKNDNYKL